MSDFRITTDNAWDLVFTSGRLEVIRGPDARAQRIRIALKHFMGEWFRDQNAGTDFFDKILGKSTELTRRAEIRRRILEIPGIAEVTSIALRVNPTTRALTGTVQVLDGSGEVVETSLGG